MEVKEQKKQVPIYFYYLAISKQKDSKDDSKYDISEIKESFTKLLKYIVSKGLTDRKVDNKPMEKVVWLDSFEDLNDGNYNLIFKSAKYNHVRTEIDTETMETLGTRKRKQDGDEEKTHLCIRLAEGEYRFLAVHESNHYGISIRCIVDYLNNLFIDYNENNNDNYHYSVSYEIMPGDDFITSLKKAKTTTLLKLVVNKSDIQDDFMQFAGRDEISDDVEIILRRPKGSKKLPENLIKSYYDSLQSNNKIKRISVKGTNNHGEFEASTDLIKMKHFLQVNTLPVTNEVDSTSFFESAQNFINDIRRR